MNRPPPAVTKRARRSASSSGTCTSFTRTTAAWRRSASDTVVGVRVTSSTRGDSLIARARVRNSASRSAPLRLITRAWTGSDGDTTKWKTLSRVRPSAGRRTVPRMLRDATVNGVERHAARSAGRDVGRERLDRIAVDLERERRAGDRLRAVIDDAGRDDDAIVILEPRALQRHRRHRQIGRLAGRDVDRRQRRPLGQLHVVAAGRLLPSAPLEVADQEDLAPRQGRLAEQAAGELQRGGIPGRARARRGGGERRTRGGRDRPRSGRRLRRRTRRRPATRDRPDRAL